jgi:hypothetical protein
MGQAYQCWGRICREVNVFLRFEYPVFYVIYPFVAYLLAHPRNIYSHCNAPSAERFETRVVPFGKGKHFPGTFDIGNSERSKLTDEIFISPTLF